MPDSGLMTICSGTAIWSNDHWSLMSSGQYRLESHFALKHNQLLHSQLSSCNLHLCNMAATDLALVSVAADA
eukprot:6331322-Amphidinium_carterae.1